MPDLMREWIEAQTAAPGVLADLPPIEKVFEELSTRFHQGKVHLHCDHKIPIEERPDLRLDLDGMQTLCSRCHGAKTMAESVAPHAQKVTEGDRYSRSFSLAMASRGHALRT
jgi:hypothetical protein